MANDENRKILLNLCQSVRDLIRCQEEANEQCRALYFALKQDIPDLEKRVRDAHQKHALSATRLSVRLGRARQKLDTVIDSLKR